MKKMNFKTAFIILGSIVALSIAIHVPLAWFYGWHISDNGTVSMFVNIKFASDTTNILYYFYVVVKFIMPMLILIVTSILIIKKVPIYYLLTYYLPFHTSSVERFSENFDEKAVTYLIFFIGTH